LGKKGGGNSAFFISDNQNNSAPFTPKQKFPKTNLSKIYSFFFVISHNTSNLVPP
jgi:hypothetical protein